MISLGHGMLAGADCIDELDVLRAGSRGLVLGHALRAPSTLGTFLRAFSFGHVQLERVLEQSLRRAWTAGAGPGGERLVLELDSLIGQVYGEQKQGAGSGYTNELGYQPLLATRAGSAEVLQIPNRKAQANTQRGNPRLVAERDDPRPRRLGLRETRLFRRLESEGIELAPVSLTP